MVVVNLGCGFDVRQGWINIDGAVPTKVGRDGTINIGHDLRHGIPVDDAIADVVYSSHFFEHLDTESTLAVMRECLRILKPLGLFRAALPKSCVKACAEGRVDFFAKLDAVVGEDGLPPREVRAPIDYIHRSGTFWDHKTLYDAEKAGRLLKFVGFVDFAEVPFDPEFDPPDEMRRAGSFYVVARKPG